MVAIRRCLPTYSLNLNLDAGRERIKVPAMETFEAN